MSALHIRTTVQAGSELWHFRLYAVPDYQAQVFINGSAAGHMKQHLALLVQSQAATPVEFDPILISDPVGDKTCSIDGEMLQGSPTYQNVKLSLKPDPVFALLVDALRDLHTEVWVEIVIEQAVEDAPPLKPGAFYWPRKTRLAFWGKADKKESTGDVRREKATLSGSSYKSDASKNAAHAGTLDLTFVHWLKVRGSIPTASWLDGVKAAKSNPPGFLPNGSPLGGLGGTSGAPGSIGYIGLPTGVPPPPWQYIPISQLLYPLVAAISPTALFAMCDERLLAPESDDATHSGNGALEIRSALYNGNVKTKSLAEIWIPIRMTQFYFTSGGFDVYSVFDTPLFEAPASDGSVGPISLYNIKDLAEAIVRLPEEFFFKFGVELPTLEEADALPLVPSSSAMYRMKYWPQCTRWLFQCVDKPTAEFYLDPNEATIKYNPAAQWTTKATFSLPTPKNTGPESGHNSYGADADLQSEYSAKLLFRFTATYRPTLNTLAYQPSGCELYLGPDEAHLGDIRMGTGQVGVIAEEGWLKFANFEWAEYHAYLFMLRWGNCRASVEFDSKRRGIEPFGASNTSAQKPRRDYRLNDIGDFPLLRHFEMRTGMLPTLDYAVQEIALAPKKPLHIKALEMTQLDKKSGPLNVLQQEEPPLVPPPPPPPRITTPTASATITGGHTQIVSFTVDQPGYPIASVKLFINNDFLDYSEANAVNSYSFTWDTTGMPTGAVTIKAIAYDTEGQSGSASVSVTIV